MTYTKHHTEGLVLKTFDRGEADRGYHLFTRELGLVYATAQGVRKQGSKLRFGLQHFSHSDVSLVRARGGWRITDAHPREGFFSDVVSCQKRKILVRRLLGLLVKFLQGEESNVPLYASVVEGLIFLSRNTLSQEDMRNVEVLTVLRMLYHLGYLDSTRFGYLVETQHVNDMLLFEAGRVRRYAVPLINRTLREVQV